MSSTRSARASTTSECPELAASYRASAEAGIPRSSMSSTALKSPPSAVIATSEPSLTAYPVGQSPGAHAVGPWVICYIYHSIGTAGLGIRRRDVAREIDWKTLTPTSSPPTLPLSLTTIIPMAESDHDSESSLSESLDTKTLQARSMVRETETGQNSDLGDRQVEYSIKVLVSTYY